MSRRCAALVLESMSRLVPVQSITRVSVRGVRHATLPCLAQHKMSWSLQTLRSWFLVVRVLLSKVPICLRRSKQPIIWLRMACSLHPAKLPMLEVFPYRALRCLRMPSTFRGPLMRLIQSFKISWQTFTLPHLRLPRSTDIPAILSLVLISQAS